MIIDSFGEYSAHSGMHSAMGQPTEAPPAVCNFLKSIQSDANSALVAPPLFTSQLQVKQFGRSSRVLHALAACDLQIYAS